MSFPTGEGRRGREREKHEEKGIESKQNTLRQLQYASATGVQEKRDRERMRGKERQ